MKTNLVPKYLRMLSVLWLAIAPVRSLAAELPYPIVGTGQTNCYGNATVMAPPQPGQKFYGQNAQHPGRAPSYRDNGDGTVTDLNTGLMWVKARGQKMSWDAALAGTKTCRVGGHDDWRMPTIKELYSLINFSGEAQAVSGRVPFIDTNYFGFAYGDTRRGERMIDCQDWSATEYVGTTMNGQPTAFGVNFADGRIKGYPKFDPRLRGPHPLYVRYVRGNPAYGKNDFHDNGDGTVSDRATGLMWAKADSGTGMNWPDALAWVQKKSAEQYLGHADWRLPDAKELQSIVDYSRVPASAPFFRITKLSDGEYPFFWSSTTHLDGPPGRSDRLATEAVYFSFGRALGWMSFPPGGAQKSLLDVHGAGAQRSDPKVGDAKYFPRGRGPQGDVIRINNFVRLVRDEMK